jgi:ATP-dependent Clp protease ATP-binding subunit ClpA
MSSQSKIDPALEARLRQMRLRLDTSEQDTLAIKHVPASPSFNKAKTNLLIKRSAPAAPCVVCVDDDLRYSGTDRELSKAFSSGPTQQGWRILTFGGSLHGDLSKALEFALDMLGTDPAPESAHVAQASTGNSLLARWAESLTHPSVACLGQPTLFRDEAIEQVATCTLSWEGHLPLILGNSGTGKTNLAHGVASMLAKMNKEVLSVNLGSIMAGTLFESERESLLTSLLREAREAGTVLALELAHWALIGLPRGPALLREALDQGSRLIAVSDEGHVNRFAAHPLGSRVEIIRLDELCANDSRRVLEALRPAISSHHGIEIDEEVEHAAVERSIALDGSLPGKAVRLLDLASARASLTGAKKVTLLDVYVTASRMPETRG